jgi:hypothetical protein
MSLSKRSYVAVLAAGIAVSLVGCSEYPDSGTLDTKFLRSEAAIIEVDGGVYGVKTGTLDAFVAFDYDSKLLNNLESRAWSAHLAGEPLPKIELTYPGAAASFDIAAVQAELGEAVVATEKGVDADIVEDIAELQTERDEMAAKLETVSAGGAGFESYVDDAKTAYEKAQTNLRNAIDAYNAAVQGPLTKTNALAEKNGLKTLRSHNNPIGNIRSIDYSDRAVPASCPAQRGYTTVDLRSEQKLCAYIRIPRGFDVYANEIAGFAKSAMIKIPELKANLGGKGGWNRDATGAYATLESAEEHYETKVSEAKNKFGDNRQREREQAWLVREIEKLDSRLADLRSKEYRQDELARTSSYDVDLSESTEEAIDQYLMTASEDLMSRVVKVSPLTLEGEIVTFDGVTGGLEGAIILAEFIAEKGSRRSTVPTMNYIDLTDLVVKEASELAAEMTRDSVRKAMSERMDLDDQDEVLDALYEMLDDAADAREDAREVAAS